MVLGQLEDNTIDDKYLRLGHINNEKLSDTIAIKAAELLPGDVLPPRWQYLSEAKFVDKFGRGFKWAKTASYHCLFFDGQYVIRIWTDVGKNHAYIDINNILSSFLFTNYKIENIPSGSLRKCSPTLKRIKLSSVDNINDIIDVIKTIYKYKV